MDPGARARVYDVVTRYPGLHLRGIERELGISAPLAQYHLRKLEESGFVESRASGGYTRFYPTEKARALTPDPQEQNALAVLREQVPLHVALLLLDEGSLTHTQLVERLGLAKSTVSYHLAKLAQVGVVEREPGAHRIRLRDRDATYRLLLTYRPTRGLIDRFADLWGSLYD